MDGGLVHREKTWLEGGGREVKDRRKERRGSTKKIEMLARVECRRIGRVRVEDKR